MYVYVKEAKLLNTFAKNKFVKTPWTSLYAIEYLSGNCRKQTNKPKLNNSVHI